MTSNFKKYFIQIITTLGVTQNIYGVLPPTINVVKRSAFTRNDCKMLISQHESQNKIPTGLLTAIADVESEFGPYAVNCNGRSRQFTNIAEAKAYVTGLRNQGIIDINIGPLQINYAYHQTKFTNAAAILDPYQNITYAAKYLVYLKKVHGSWVKAVKFYHSPNVRCQNIYITKVMNCLKRIDHDTYREMMAVKNISLKPARAIYK